MQKLTDKTFDKYLGDSTPLFVMFHASFSGPCRIAMPNFEEAAARRGNQIRFATFDLDGNVEIPERYGLRSIPLFILFVDGKPNDPVTGALSTDQILEIVKDV